VGHFQLIKSVDELMRLKKVRLKIDNESEIMRLLISQNIKIHDVTGEDELVPESEKMPLGEIRPPEN
jgi:hypothetical protein